MASLNQLSYIIFVLLHLLMFKNNSGCTFSRLSLMGHVQLTIQKQTKKDSIESKLFVLSNERTVYFFKLTRKISLRLKFSVINNLLKPNGIFIENLDRSWSMTKKQHPYQNYLFSFSDNIDTYFHSIQKRKIMEYNRKQNNNGL